MPELTLAQARELYPEALKFDESGVIGEGVLRRYCRSNGFEDTALGLVLFVRLVFKRLAQEYMN